MTIQLLDIAPYPRDWDQQQQLSYREKMDKAKELRKEEQLTEKAKKKAEKAKKKAEKKAAKAKKKAEKKAQKHVKDLSAATPKTIATVQVPSNQGAQPILAAMPTGVVLAVCASLMICFGSAWFCRRFNSETTAHQS